MGHRRPEDVHDDGPRGRATSSSWPARHRTSPSTRASPCSCCRWTPRACRSRRSTPWAASAPTSRGTTACGSSDHCRVGDVDAGWSVMHAALVYERTGANWGEPHHVLDEGARPPRPRRRGHRAPAGRFAGYDEVSRLLVFRSAWLASEGGLPLVEGSMAKLFTTEWFTRHGRRAARPGRSRRHRRRGASSSTPSATRR